jgi:2-polyprenyl-6-methoxyphenol hydroxylase-like FAD-dependent oxidoreductase
VAAKHAKILVSGGGIAGCTLAWFLERSGRVPVVVEAANEFRRVGYLLALNRQIGQKVADKMGVLQQLRAFELPLPKNVPAGRARRH